MVFEYLRSQRQTDQVQEKNKLHMLGTLFATVFSVNFVSVCSTFICNANFNFYLFILKQLILNTAE